MAEPRPAPADAAQKTAAHQPVRTEAMPLPAREIAALAKEPLPALVRLAHESEAARTTAAHAPESKPQPLVTRPAPTARTAKLPRAAAASRSRQLADSLLAPIAQSLQSLVREQTPPTPPPAGEHLRHFVTPYTAEAAAEVPPAGELFLPLAPDDAPHSEQAWAWPQAAPDIGPEPAARLEAEALPAPITFDSPVFDILPAALLPAAEQPETGPPAPLPAATVIDNFAAGLLAEAVVPTEAQTPESDGAPNHGANQVSALAGEALSSVESPPVAPIVQELAAALANLDPAGQETVAPLLEAITGSVAKIINLPADAPPEMLAEAQAQLNAQCAQLLETAGLPHEAAAVRQLVGVLLAPAFVAGLTDAQRRDQLGTHEYKFHTRSIFSFAQSLAGGAPFHAILGAFALLVAHARTQTQQAGSALP